MPAPTIRRNALGSRENRKVGCAASVAATVGEITPGCEIYGLTAGDWSFIDLIEHILRATGPADVTVGAWTIGLAEVAMVRRMLDGGLIRSFRLVLDSSFPLRQSAYCKAVRETFGDGAIRLTENHAKFAIIRNESWNIAVRTSMNLNENRRIESFEISECAAMAGYLDEIASALFEKQSDTFAKSRHERRMAFGVEWGHPQNQGGGRTWVAGNGGEW